VVSPSRQKEMAKLPLQNGRSSYVRRVGHSAPARPLTASNRYCQKRTPISPTCCFA
jgi:hypothetical protein